MRVILPPFASRVKRIFLYFYICKRGRVCHRSHVMNAGAGSSHSVPLPSRFPEFMIKNRTKKADFRHYLLDWLLQ
jgi:hypothetical protein